MIHILSKSDNKLHFVHFCMSGNPLLYFTLTRDLIWFDWFFIVGGNCSDIFLMWANIISWISLESSHNKCDKIRWICCNRRLWDINVPLIGIVSSSSSFFFHYISLMNLHFIWMNHLCAEWHLSQWSSFFSCHSKSISIFHAHNDNMHLSSQTHTVLLSLMSSEHIHSSDAELFDRQQKKKRVTRFIQIEKHVKNPP